jgi:hypothetical protein
MKLIKSITVGLVFLVVAIVFLSVLHYVLIGIPASKEGVNVASFLRFSPSVCIIVLSSFALGCAWEYRRLLKSH